MNVDYADFLARKAPRAMASGFEPKSLPDHLFDFQRMRCLRASGRGRAACTLIPALGNPMPTRMVRPSSRTV